MARCARCAEDNPDRARFCLACGAEVAAPEQETHVRKTVTLVFADLTGSTAMGEQLETEALRAVTDRYFEEMHRVVESHGGTVEKFVGDAVLAVFGVPVMHEDDALRAVRAAADMQSALDRVNSDLAATWAVRIGVRIGVNTGEVVVGAARAGGSFATGDAVNVAARLEQAAGPGEVLLGAATARLVGPWVDVERLAPLTLRGKTDPVPAYLLRAVRRQPRAGPPERTPLVGRDHDLDLLRAGITRAVDGRRPHVVTVAGPAGVGKSRLVTELVRSMPDATMVLGGTCPSYGDASALAPIRAIVRAAIGVAPEGPADDSTYDRLLAMLGDSDEARVSAQRLAAVADLGGSDTTTEEIAASLRRLLTAIAGARAVVAVVEDLHFAQPALLDVLHSTVTRLHDVPVVVVTTTRRELWDARPHWGAAIMDAVTVTLSPLGIRGVRSIAEHLLSGPVADDIVAALAPTEGNPLFVEQVVELLRDGDAIRLDGGTWRLVDDAVAGTVPSTVHAILAARIDQLPADERAVLERAAVLGRSFAQDALRQLLPPRLGEEMAELLDRLREKGLIAGDDDELTEFSHVLLRDAAYERIPKRTRADLHADVVTWLDSRNDEAGLDQTSAYHLLTAVQLRRELGVFDAETVTLMRRCIDRVRRVADRLVAIDASTALRIVVDAWDACGDDRPERLDLLPSVLRVFSLGTDPRTFTRVTGEAERQAADNERWRDIAVAMHQTALSHRADADLPRWEAAIAAARRSAGDDPHLRAVVAHIDAARASFGDQPADRFITAYEASAAAALAAGETEMHAHALADLATFLHYADQPMADILRRTHQIDDELSGRPLLQAHARAAVALALAECGRRAEALAAADESRQLFSLATGSSFDPLYEGFFLADVSILCGDPAIGCATLLRAADALMATGEPGYAAAQLSMWVVRAAAAGLGPVDGALDTVESYPEHSDTPLPVLRVAAALAGAGTLSAQTARTAAAANRGQGAFVVLASAPVVVTALRLAGETEEATTVWSETVELADQLGYVVRAAQLRSIAAGDIPTSIR